jgi:hypothetical protein
MGGLARFALGLYDRAHERDTARDITTASVDMPFLVNHVSGHLVWKALLIKLRNQIARRFGHSIISDA